MKYFQQLDITDCGAACIAMIASHYGKKLNIADVRIKAGTDIIGTNIKGLIEAATKYGMLATPVKGTKKAITKTLYTPFIAHLHIVRDDDNWVDHYVVIKKITNKYIEVWDPDPLYKKQKLTYEKFFEFWTGYAVFLEPDAGFKKTDKKQNLLLKFIPVFLPHKKLLVFSFLSSILLLAFGIITSFYINTFLMK